MERYDIGPYVLHYDGEYLDIVGTPATAITTSEALGYNPDFPTRVRLGERSYGAYGDG